MGLHEIQSALKELILDAPELPEDQIARKRLFKDRFPQLTENELDDLSKMPPAGIKVYTSSVFSGERGLIENNFPITVKILERDWLTAYNSKFSLLQLTKQLHKKKPWMTTSAVELGENFVSYINEDLKELHKIAPYIIDISELELLIRKIRRAPDYGLSAEHSISIEKLETLTVDQLLELKFKIPTYLLLQKFNYDVANVRAFFIKNEDTLPDQITPSQTYTALGRDRNAYPRILNISNPIFNLLSSSEPSTEQLVARIAEAFLEDANQEKDESETFSQFIRVLIDLIDSGIIII